MQVALRQLAEDFLSSFVFLGFYLATGSLPLAVGVGMAVGVAQFALARWRGRRLEAMQWLSFGLVIVLGAISLITNDTRFIMAKPSFIHFAIGAVMLRRGWMDRYLPPLVKDNLPQQVIVLTGYAWAALMFALGLANLYVAANYSPIVWGYFLSIGATGAKIVAFFAQYVVFQILVRRRLRTPPRALPGTTAGMQANG
jgi:intracellular septation protein